MEFEKDRWRTEFKSWMTGKHLWWLSSIWGEALRAEVKMNQQGTELAVTEDLAGGQEVRSHELGVHDWNGKARKGKDKVNVGGKAFIANSWIRAYPAIGPVTCERWDKVSKEGILMEILDIPAKRWPNNNSQPALLEKNYPEKKNPFTIALN